MGIHGDSPSGNAIVQPDVPFIWWQKKLCKWIVDHVPFLENSPMENWDSRSHCMLING